MNKKLLALFAASAVGLSVLTYSVCAQSAPTPTPPANPAAPTGGRHYHPAIRAAIRALERAKAEMQAAAHDFGGHRVDAINACDIAIAQLQLALQYANQNSPGTQQAPGAQ
jgi:Spy/CpxP family protein refolding chaperone